MKTKIFTAVIAVTLLLSLSACSDYTRHRATQILAPQQTINPALQNIPVQMQEYNTVAQNSGIYPMFSEVYEADHADLYILLEETNMYYTPSLSSRIVDKTHWKGAVAKVFARVDVYDYSKEDGHDYWIFARKANFAESVNNIGWIHVTKDVLPLTEVLSVLATDHIRISEDCIDEWSGKMVSEIFPNFEETYFGIMAYEGDMALLFTTGGAGVKIKKEFIVYPIPD